MNGLMTIVVKSEYTSVHIIKPQTTVARERHRSAETVLITIFGAKSAQKQGHKTSKPLKFSSLPQNFGVQDETRTHTPERALPPQSSASTNSATWTFGLSDKRDSDPRPRPWQGRALPTELLSQILRATDGTRTRDLDLGKVALYQLSYCRNCYTISKSI